MSWDRLRAPAPWSLTLVPREVDKWTEPTLPAHLIPGEAKASGNVVGGLVSEPLLRAQGAAWETRFCVSLMSLPTPAQAPRLLPIPFPLPPHPHPNTTWRWSLASGLFSPSPSHGRQPIPTAKLCLFLPTL